MVLGVGRAGAGRAGRGMQGRCDMATWACHTAGGQATIPPAGGHNSALGAAPIRHAQAAWTRPVRAGWVVCVYTVHLISF